MASNDMNSWDEDPDERLRRHWQQVFADFEVQPRPSLSRRILGRITTRHQPRRVRWLAVAALLLLISGGLVYQLRLSAQSRLERRHSATARPVSPNQSPSTGRRREPAVPIGRSMSAGLPMTDSLAGRSLAARQLPVHPPAVPEASTPGVDAPGVEASEVEVPVGAALSERHALTRPWPADRIRLHFGARGKIPVTPRSGTKLTLATPARSFNPHFPVRTAGRVRTTGHESPSASVDRSGSSRALVALNSSVIPPLSNALSGGWLPLKPRGFSPLPNQLSALPGQRPVIRLESLHPVETVVARRRWRWFVDALPLSSFQWMTTSPVSTAYLSHINAPAIFSPATWGYQLNGGIRFQRWQAYLSVGQLRRWAYYTVNENRYRVEPSPTDPQQLVRETYAVAENVALPMIGTGLSQQMLLARGRYTVELGGQASYLPTIGQTLLGLRGGADRRLAMSRLTELQVGLSVEYGLNQLLSEHRQLAIHPLVVGLRLRLQSQLQP